MIRFDVSTLLKAPLGASLTLSIDSGPQNLTDLEVDFLRGEVRATRIESGIFVQGTVATQIHQECIRCLAPVTLPVEFHLEETYRLPGTKLTEEATYAVGSDGWIDLTPLLREQAWLSIPMKVLCQPECKGLCPHCGINFNEASCSCEHDEIDPRLEALKELL